MSYKHLAGRLIETQRSMLGEPAIDIARSIEGVTVTDDGTVAGIEGDGRVVLDELARRYTDVLGAAAESRLLAAAREFEDELVLPPSLGGPEDHDLAHRDPATHDPAGAGPAAHDSAGAGPAASDPAGADSLSAERTSGTGSATAKPETTGPAGPAAAEADSTGAVSDGGTVEAAAGGATGSDDGGTRVVSPTPSGPGEVVSPTPAGTAVDAPTRPVESGDRRPDDAASTTPAAGETRTSAAGETTSYERAADEGGELSIDEPVTVRYTVASDVTALDADPDLDSVYLLPDGRDGWQVPVSVEEAVVEAVTGATGPEADAVGDPIAPLDADRLVATLRGDGGETVSFQLRGPLDGLTVTFHRTGSLAVH